MKKTVLCYGDSNTWGCEPLTFKRYPEDVRWTGLLQQMLGDDYTVISEAQNGRTTVWNDPIENRMSGLDYLWPCMDSQHPFDLIIIMLGVNDTKTYFASEAVSIARGAARLASIAKASDFGPDDKAPEVLLVSPILIGEGCLTQFKDLFTEDSIRKSKDFAAAFKHYADEAGVHFMDAAPFAEPGTDGIHMSPEGHASLAKAFYDKVKEIIG